MLGLVALVASLLAAVASPVGAAEETADHEAATLACVGDATADQPYTDVSEDHAFRDAINCIAYYGITKGTGDGSTFSPDADVSRQAMALFIARTAGIAGVDLGDAIDAGFSDIGDAWAEAQDAINQLASKGILPKGSTYRPDDAMTRSEMAIALIGLLNKASSNVEIGDDGTIGLGVDGTKADDYFADTDADSPGKVVRAAAALYELGVTNGTGTADVVDSTKTPLDTNFDPDGTVTRGQMAAFITRALAHTSVRPEGVSAQFDSPDVVVSVRDDDFAPVANAVVDLFRIDTGGVDLALRADGSCGGEVAKVGGTYVCEIDGADPITGAGGDTRVNLAPGVDDGGTTVWVWTGDTDDTVDDDTDLFKLDIDEAEETSMATKASVSTEASGKAHLGEAVLYTLQLQDDNGDVTVGADGEKSASYVAELATHVYVGSVGALGGDTDSNTFRDAATIVTPILLTTDSDGKATITVSAPTLDRDPDTKSDKYLVVLTVFVDPEAEHNAPNGGDTLDGDGNPFVSAEVVFSTEDSSREDGSVSVESAATYVAGAARGTSNRATVTVADQYGDPISGSRVWLTTDLADDDGDLLYMIGGGRSFAVGRDGSYTFGYEREGDSGATETLSAFWDDDGDTCSASDIEENDFTSWNVYRNTLDDTSGHTTWNHDGDADTDPVLVTKDCFDQRPLLRNAAGDRVEPGNAVDGEADDRVADDFKGTLPKRGVATVQWAAAAPDDSVTGTTYVIQEFDTDTNTIFVTTTEDGDNDSATPETVVADSAFVLGYDSNDRFNNDGEASSYAGFEKALSKGASLTWAIVGPGSRAVNTFEFIPA